MLTIEDGSTLSPREVIKGERGAWDGEANYLRFVLEAAPRFNGRHVGVLLGRRACLSQGDEVSVVRLRQF